MPPPSNDTVPTPAERAREAGGAECARAASGAKPGRESSWLARLKRVFRRGDPPIVVGVDLGLMQAGGANGGVKPLVFSFLREIATAQPERFRFVYFASAELAPELRGWMRTGDRIAAADERVAAGFDVLYAPFGRSPLMRPDVPAVSLIVDLLHRDLPTALPIEEVNYRHEWFSQIAREATSFQCISHYTAERLQTHYAVDARRCVVTHIPVHMRLDSAAKHATAVRAPVDGPFFFYPANFWPHKNHATLLAAYRDYCDSRPEAAWPLVFTGHSDASMHALVTQAAAIGLEGRVRFLGHVSEDELVAVWRAAGALVYPSLHEGFGIPLLEAMAFGCPIIASNTTSMPEVGGAACEYVDPRDAQSIADALRRVSGDVALRNDLVRRGTKRLETFSLRREAAKLADQFVRAVGR